MKKIILISLMICSVLYGVTQKTQYPEGEIGDMIQLGKDIINNTNTHPLTKKLVENKLKCVSCHLSGDDGHPGSTKNVGTFVGVATKYPLYKKREGVVQTLQDRMTTVL